MSKRPAEFQLTKEIDEAEAVDSLMEGNVSTAAAKASRHESVVITRPPSTLRIDTGSGTTNTVSSSSSAAADVATGATLVASSPPPPSPTAPSHPPRSSIHAPPTLQASPPTPT